MQLDAGSHYSTEFKNVRIPSLEEVFDTIGDRLMYNLELTEYRRPMTDIVSKTVNLVEKYRLQSYVLYSSFNPIELFRLSRLVDNSHIALLMHDRTPKLIRGLLKVVVPHSTYHPVDSLITEKLLLDARLKGKRINVWTVNDRSRMQTLYAWGVDGIITDMPEQAVDVRKGLGKSV
jgi:glycerophosphoryl diester phosphodiesterase